MPTVLVAALVSAFVALAVEWIAKPSLEARKERILLAERRRREALRACRALLVRFPMMADPRPELSPFAAEARAEALALTKELHDTLIDVALDMPREGADFGMWLVGFLAGLLRSANDGATVREAASEPVLILAAILERMPPWSRGRAAAAAAARSYLDGRRKAGELTP